MEVLTPKLLLLPEVSRHVPAGLCPGSRGHLISFHGCHVHTRTPQEDTSSVLESIQSRVWKATEITVMRLLHGLGRARARVLQLWLCGHQGSILPITALRGSGLHRALRRGCQIA